jgi:methyl-accepting chemotaxis protein
LNRLKNVSIRSKLLGGFGLLAAIVLGLSVLAVDGLSRVNDAAVEVRENWLPATRMLGQAQELATRYRQFQATVMVVATPEDILREQRAMVATREEFAEVWQRYAATVVPEEAPLAAAALSAWRGYLAVEDRLMAHVRQGDAAGADGLYIGEMRDSFTRLRQTMTELLDFNLRSGQAAARAGEATYVNARFVLVVGCAVGVLSGLGLAWALGRGVSRSLSRAVDAMGRVAAGQLDIDVVGRERGDEIGAMARALEDLRLTSLRARDLAAEAAKTREGMEANRRRAQLDLADRVERQLGAVTTTLSGAVERIQGGLRVLTGNAERATEGASSVASAAAQATANVQTVAAAAEELASSVGEITRQVAQAAGTARKAAGEAQQADGEVAGLSEAATRIGDVVRLIGDIAGQTNLLALNATIEAARAGEAGKGFAVVASEVKALAGQTAKATEEIGTQIAAIQAATQRAVGSIKGISAVVAEVDQIATAIAAAVEEQGAATQEIARNVAEAAAGTNDVSANIARISGGAVETRAEVQRLSENTDAVARQGDTLRSELNALLSGLRAA